MGDYIGDDYKGYQGGSRSLDSGSNNQATGTKNNSDCKVRALNPIMWVLGPSRCTVAMRCLTSSLAGVAAL